MSIRIFWPMASVALVLTFHNSAFGQAAAGTSPSPYRTGGPPQPGQPTPVQSTLSRAATTTSPAERHTTSYAPVISTQPGGAAKLYMSPGESLHSSENRELNAALEQLKSSATDGPAKQAAREKVESTLGAQFDRDMEMRSKQIEELEKQIVLLKVQMQKRTEAKNRLIELRIELALNEAEGLGFPSGWSQPLGRAIPPQVTFGWASDYTSAYPGQVTAPLPPTPSVPSTPPTSLLLTPSEANAVPDEQRVPTSRSPAR